MGRACAATSAKILLQLYADAEIKLTIKDDAGSQSWVAISEHTILQLRWVVWQNRIAVVVNPKIQRYVCFQSA
jgi:hypothetical protein